MYVFKKGSVKVGDSFAFDDWDSNEIVKGKVVSFTDDYVYIEWEDDTAYNYEYDEEYQFDKLPEQKDSLPEELEEYSYYKYSYKGIKIDPYRILSIYGISCPAQQHAIKKLLRAGNSVKELRQDIQEVIDTLKRKLEMLDEDEVATK